MRIVFKIGDLFSLYNHLNSRFNCCFIYKPEHQFPVRLYEYRIDQGEPDAKYKEAQSLATV